MENDDDLAVGDIHDVLRNDRRREVLTALMTNGGQTTIRDLSERIAAIESDEDPPPRNVRQSVYVSLHQTHLPKLDELDIIEYDTDAKTVKLRSEAEQMKHYMNEGSSESWGPISIGSALVGGLVVLLGLGGIIQNQLIWGGIALVLFLAIGGISGYQYYESTVS